MKKQKSAKPDGLSIARQGYDYSWWPALYRQQDFRMEVRRVYDEELRPMLETLIGEQPENGIRTLDQYAKELSASAEMNFLRWRIFNHETRAVKTGADYLENIEYLRRWIRARMAYLDTAW